MGSTDAYSAAELATLGVSCVETPQLSGCFDGSGGDLDDAQRDHCERFALAQSLHVSTCAAALLAFLAHAVALRSRKRAASAMRAFAFVNGLLALYSSSAVGELVKDSYMFAGERALDVECDEARPDGKVVCHGPGPSYFLVSLAAWALLLASGITVAIMLARRPADESDEDDDVTFVRVPLLAEVDLNGQPVSVSVPGPVPVARAAAVYADSDVEDAVARPVIPVRVQAPA